VDRFVIFDCVQFPRRGRAHRTEVVGPAGRVEWLTLPLARQPRDVLIRELEFASDARERLDWRLARYGWLDAAASEAAARIDAFLRGPLGAVVDFLEDGLRLVTGLLGLEVPMVRSSVLGLDPSLRGQERVVAAAAAVGATHYVNAPGGRRLYRAETFRRSGIELSFLRPYGGGIFQLLPALFTDGPEAVRRDVLASTEVEPA
jgi:hypothetical protein